MPSAVKSVLPVTEPKRRIVLDGAAYTRIRHALNERLGMVGIARPHQDHKSRYSAPIGPLEALSTVTVPTTGAQINIDAGRLELGTPYGSRLP